MSFFNAEDYQLAKQILPQELLNTLLMVGVSTFLAVVVGGPLGVLLTVTGRGHIKENLFLHKVLDLAVNVGRSFPFAILLVALIPITRFIVGTSLGTAATIIPLAMAAIPFVARTTESALSEVSRDMIEAAMVMGSGPWQIITKVLLVEALPGLYQGITSTIINVIGYSAMAGMVGGGGLGKVAIQYGYQRFNNFMMISTVLMMILLVQLVQWIGFRAVKSLLKKRGVGLHENE